jgi:hypothetical protein
VSTTYFIIEASHLFRAGDKFQTQFFVSDVVNFLQKTYFPGTDSNVTVLHGSVKTEQGDRYAAALERNGVRVVRMKPIASVAGADRWYFKPTYYMHGMMGTDIPVGSTVVLIGFHNPRYLSFIEKYYKQYHISVAAFATPSKKQGFMTIPAEFQPYLKSSINLDECAEGIKSEFRRKSGTKP